MPPGFNPPCDDNSSHRATKTKTTKFGQATCGGDRKGTGARAASPPRTRMPVLRPVQRPGTAPAALGAVPRLVRRDLCPDETLIRSLTCLKLLSSTCSSRCLSAREPQRVPRSPRPACRTPRFPSSRVSAIPSDATQRPPRHRNPRFLSPGGVSCRLAGPSAGPLPGLPCL